MQPLLKPPWSLLIASRKSPNSLIGCINLFPGGLQPSWPWALPLYIRPQLPHSLDLTYSPMFPRFGESFSLLESTLTFSACQTPPYPSRLQVLLVELNRRQRMTQKVPRPAGFREMHGFLFVEFLSNSSQQCCTREPGLFMPLLALLNCVLLMCVIVLMLGLLC